LLTCELNHLGNNDEVRLTWKLDDKDVAGGSFVVPTRHLREAETQIRAALAQLEAISEPFTPDSEEYAKQLRDLAKRGQALAELAIGASDGKNGSGASAFHKWFMSKVANAPADKFELLIIHKNLDTVGARKHVAPWHLAFTPGVDIKTLSPTPEALNRFWCIQFRLAVVTPNYTDSVRMAQKLPPNETRITAVLEVGQKRTRGIDQKVHDDIDDPVIIGTPEELLDHSDRHSMRHQFNYIWLHPSGDGAYRLGGDYIDRQVIEGSHKRVKPEYLLMTMFDGDCIMRDRTDWIEPLMKRLRGGLIVPETDIRLESKRYFGWLFMKEMIQHAQSLSDAIAHARGKLWPRSLIYGFYCNARHVYVDPVPAGALDEMFNEIDAFIGRDGGGVQ